jgi:rare lipoprotein A
MLKKSLTLWILAILMALPLAVMGKVAPGYTQNGKASYYHDSLHGRKTASGEVYNKRAMTAAHKRLPLGSKVRVTNVSSGKSIVVKINDRGPFVKGRIIDLSRTAARKLGMIRKGVVKVQVEVLSVPKRRGRGS